MSTTHLDKGRRAFAKRAWLAARESLMAANRVEPLSADDCWRLALASYLVGYEDDFVQSLQQAHQSFLDSGQPLLAVRSAYWLGSHLAHRGDIAQASGWFARAARAAESSGPENAGRGYVLLQSGYQQLVSGDFEASARTGGEAAAIGRRFGERDLEALAIHQQGRALLRMGRVDDGLALLDEAMVAVTSDELSPPATGLIYCSVLSACAEVHALRRAREWTAALADWCELQPDMVAYTGECRVSRAEILQRRGEWTQAIQEARHAAERFARGPGPGATGSALYQEGEVHRLRGDFAAAERAFHEASRAGRQPQPGLALLRLAQGDAAAAAAAMRRALAETKDPLRRTRMLPAYIEILLELGEVEGATTACDELEETAGTWSGAVLDTLTAHARGAIALAAGKPELALAPLRQACEEWTSMDVPYEAARVRALLASACRQLGDREGAAMELEAACGALRALGAAPELARLGSASPSRGNTDHGLTPREREVLSWLATGRTNRAIAETLFISEKTVARHVANIYQKLGVSSRSAATAYAYEHDLLGSSA